jgi:hypothetical protein
MGDTDDSLTTHCDGNCGDSEEGADPGTEAVREACTEEQDGSAFESTGLLDQQTPECGESDTLTRAEDSRDGSLTAHCDATEPCTEPATIQERDLRTRTKPTLSNCGGGGEAATPKEALDQASAARVDAHHDRGEVGHPGPTSTVKSEYLDQDPVQSNGETVETGLEDSATDLAKSIHLAIGNDMALPLEKVKGVMKSLRRKGYLKRDFVHGQRGCHRIFIDKYVITIGDNTGNIVTIADEKMPKSPPKKTQNGDPDPTPDPTPDLTPHLTPDHTPDHTPDATPDELTVTALQSNLSPSQGMVVDPDVAPQVAPDLISDLTPDLAPHATLISPPIQERDWIKKTKPTLSNCGCCGDAPLTEGNGAVRSKQVDRSSINH